VQTGQEAQLLPTNRPTLLMHLKVSTMTDSQTCKFYNIGAQQ